MSDEQPGPNGAEAHGQAMRHRVLVESDGTAVRLVLGCPVDVAEGILFRALAHVQRQILRAQLAQDAAPKVELVPASGIARLGGPPA